MADLQITYSQSTVPHKYRNRFLREAGSGSVITGGSSSSSSAVDLAPYLKKDEAGNLYLEKTALSELFEKETVDGVTVIKAKYSLYSIGGLSAYGNGNSSSGNSSTDGGTEGSDDEIAEVEDAGYIVYTKAEVDALIAAIPQSGSGSSYELTKAKVEAVLTGDISSHSHSAYALSTHNHNSTYALIGHTHSQYQSTLTTDQLAAANSGVNATDWSNVKDNTHNHSNTDALNKLSLIDGKLKIDCDVYSTGGISAYGEGSSAANIIEEDGYICITIGNKKYKLAIVSSEDI